MSIGQYLDAHQGEVVTAEQIAEATGESEHFVRVYMREASDRDWVHQVPGGWEIP